MKVYGNGKILREILTMCTISDDRLVRIALQRWFTRVCEDPILQQDNEMRSFIESDFGVRPFDSIRRL